jgi:hypothetical protein
MHVKIVIQTSNCANMAWHYRTHSLRVTMEPTIINIHPNDAYIKHSSVVPAMVTVWV